MAITGPTGAFKPKPGAPKITPGATVPSGTTPPAPTFNITPKSPNTGKGTTALAWDGTKQVPTTDLKKQWLLLPADTKKIYIDYAASIGIPAGKASTVWNNLVAASQASVQQGKPMSPLQILQKSIQTGLPAASGLTPTIRTRAYNDTEATALVRSAYAKIFNRVPTDLDLNAPASVIDPVTGQVMKDPKTGIPLTWMQALQSISNTPDFQEQTSYTVDPNGNVKTVTTKPAMDPTTWLENQMTKSYVSDIKSGKVPPEVKMEQQYAQLAAEYGHNVYNPATKQLTPSALLDLGTLEAGTQTLDQLRKGWAETTIPNVASAAHTGLQSGAITLKGYAQPAITRVAELLDKNPNTVTLQDPYVQQYLKGDGKNFLSTGQLDSLIKNDPTWKYTQNAHAQLDDLASGILQRFGVNA
jgi:hypothetical protein